MTYFVQSQHGKQNSFVVLLLIFYLVLINKLVAKKQAHPSHSLGLLGLFSRYTVSLIVASVKACITLLRITLRHCELWLVTVSINHAAFSY